MNPEEIRADLDILADSQRGTYDSDGAYERLRESFAAARVEVSQLRAKAKEGLRKVSSASVKAVMDANESVDYINGLEAAYAIFRAVLAEPLGSTEDPPATEAKS
jgi:hypothetical protein